MEAISVVGLGKLGLPLAAALAGRGFRVIGVDIDEDVVVTVNQHKPHIYEPGLAELMASVGNKLIATTHICDAVDGSDVTIILVPTPSNPDGSFSSEYVLQVCKALGENLKNKEDYHLVVIASTVMPGECEGAIWDTLEQASGKWVGPEIGLCCCPEFVALGNIINGFQQPDFVLIGAVGEMAAQKLKKVYEKFCSNNPPIVITTLVNAEIAKIALNCYVTTKITFANQLAALCEKIPGAHVDEVTNAIGLDSRIGKRYLKGATAFGGPCFPRDVRAMSQIAYNAEGQVELIDCVKRLNLKEYRRLADIVLTETARFSEPPVVGILGLTFKPNTDVCEKSVGMALVSMLKEVSALSVLTHDPMVSPCSCDSAQELVDNSDIVVLVVDWPEFRELEFYDGQTVIDVWRVLDRAKLEHYGVWYVAIGVG